MSETTFSAKEPSLGYYYQLRLALYLVLDSKKKNATVQLESLDDIVIEDIDTKDLYQTKLHIKSKPDLTNSSPDFWKTIRIWSEHIAEGNLDIDNTIFTLVTTAQVNESSFINDLKFAENTIRDTDSIQKAMLQVANTSSNQGNIKSYTAFKALSPEQQIKLITNISVFDNSLSIDQALNSICSVLRFATHPKRLGSLVERLEGWWFENCINLLQNKLNKISLEEIHVKISDINDTLKEDNLPDDFSNPIDLDEESLENYQDKLFIKQLKLVAVRSNALRSAINDFHRAFKQRSKWLREELTNIHEEDAFENKLIDHWKNVFSLMKDDCEGMNETTLQKIGYDFYKKYYVERIPPVKIRERFSSEYLTRGSCHMLSDDKKIGWHPNFITLLP